MAETFTHFGHGIMAHNPVIQVSNAVLSVSFEVAGWGKDVGSWDIEHQRCEPLGGSGGMLPQKILKSRHSEMPFSAFSNRYFPLKWQCKLGNKTLLVKVILKESTFFIISSSRFR